MKVTSEPKAVARYAYLTAGPDEWVDINNMMSTLSQIDQKNDFIYGFSQYGIMGFWNALHILQDVGYAELKDNGFRLTVEGRAFAQELEFDEELEQDLEEKKGKKSRKR